MLFLWWKRKGCCHDIVSCFYFRHWIAGHTAFSWLFRFWQRILFDYISWTGWKYAERFLRRGNEAYINIYEVCGDLSGFKKKEFTAYNEEWLDYVMKCRQGHQVESFDWISGGIADDKVFNTIDLYFANMISKDEALHRLVYEKSNQQICITSSKLLTENLLFKEAIKLSL